MPSPVAIILAGGANRRFWPLQQKSLLRFGDQTLLDRHVGALAAAGFADVVVVANPANEAKMRALAAGAPARLHVVVQPEPLGMGDAVLQCAPLLTGQLGDRPILITQTHDLVEPSLFKTLVDRLAADDADGFVVGVKLKSYFPGGYLVIRDGRAADVIEKPPPGSEPSDLMKIVDDLVRRPAELLLALREVDPNPSDHYERALGRLMDRGTIRVVDYPGPWVPIKYPWDVLPAAELFLGTLPNELRQGEGVFVHPSASVSGPVWLGDRVRIFAGAAVVGPAIVGSGTIVGNGALIRGSIVGRECIVGFATEVARSYLGDGCELHTNYVGDSVLGEDVAFGSGTVTANLRLDERSAILEVEGRPVDTGMPKLGALIGSHVRTGINVSIHPGVRIGSNCAVGPGLLLDRDLADNQFVKLKQQLDVRPNRLTIDRASRAKFHKAL
ncbi:MAG TPA: NTP transferase domain-containing protein [Chloroflexota bacterium]|jgi:bifunctional UDP-N-acetylglucosamine pyrophosphorylase/glucosamine-1-phosphate N-acetyltransferase